MECSEGTIKNVLKKQVGKQVYNLSNSITYKTKNTPSCPDKKQPNKELFPVSKSVIVNLQGAAAAAQPGEIKVKTHACVVEGVKASFTHTATGVGCSEIETVFFDISDEGITTSHAEDLMPCFDEVTAVIDLGEYQEKITVKDSIYFEDFIEVLVAKYGGKIQRISDIQGANDWPYEIKLQAH